MAIRTYSNGIGSYSSATIRYAPYGILESPDFVNIEMMLSPTVFSDLVAAGKDVEEVSNVYGNISWDGGLLGSGYRIQERALLPASGSSPVLSQCNIQYGKHSAALVFSSPVRDYGDDNPKFIDPFSPNYPNTLTPLNFPWTTADLFGDGDQWVLGGLEWELGYDISYLVNNTPEPHWRLYPQDRDVPLRESNIRRVTLGSSSEQNPRDIFDFVASVDGEESQQFGSGDQNQTNEYFPVAFYV